MKARTPLRFKRRTALLLLAGWSGSVLPVCARGREAAGTAAPLLVLGDSLSVEYGIARGSGWVELLRTRLRERGNPLAVVNASVSGETSAGGRARIDALLRREQPSIVIIELGGNDALRGLDLAALRANLLEIVRRSQQVGARVLLVGMKVPPNYGRTYSEAFQRVFVEIALETGAARVPFLLDGIADRAEFFQADRIHPNERAQPLMLDRVWSVLQTLL